MHTWQLASGAAGYVLDFELITQRGIARPLQRNLDSRSQQPCLPKRMAPRPPRRLKWRKQSRRVPLPSVAVRPVTVCRLPLLALAGGLGVSNSTAERCMRRVQAAADKTFGLKNKSKSKVVKQCAPRRLCRHSLW